MDKEVIFLAEESLQGGYDARALGYSIFTQADSLAELGAMVQDALRCHFGEAERPRLMRLRFLRNEPISHVEGSNELST